MIATAEEIAAALGGRRCGKNWIARCPAHRDRRPSFSIAEGDDGQPLVHCFSGCTQDEVIDALRALGLWADKGFRNWRPYRRFLTRNTVRANEKGQNTCFALEIWNSATDASGTLIETYLKSRGLKVSVPKEIRFLRGLKHPSGNFWPAMVALVTEGVTGAPCAIHRTYISRNGSGKAPVDRPKLMLGPCAGGAVRLSPATDTVMIGEGIETVLAAMCATGLPGWAALSTAGLRSLDLPDSIQDVIVLADGDDPGETAARGCAIHWRREVRRVRIARPRRGIDFNDLLNDKSTTGDRE